MEGREEKAKEKEKRDEGLGRKLSRWISFLADVLSMKPKPKAKSDKDVDMGCPC